jgi:hypothetical protein
MTEISITQKIYEYFDEIEDTEIRQNIIMYMEKYKIGNRGISIKTKYKIKFKNQIGGEAYEIDLKDGKTYYYNINDVEPISKSKYKMLFLTFDNINECACLTFGKKESNNDVLRIDGIKSFEECILCKDKKHKFKSGDILMQIILKLVKNDPQFSHINKIELADASQKKCYDIGLQLIYLRTMTHGVPYYAKFGFRPVLKTDYENVFVYNRNNFNLNKTMTRDTQEIKQSLISGAQQKNDNIFLGCELLKIINKKKVNMNDKTYQTYKKYIKNKILTNKINNPIKIISDVIKVVDNSIAEIKDNELIVIGCKDELKGLCDFVRNIYIDIYKYLGYKFYERNLWELNINRNKKKLN